MKTEIKQIIEKWKPVLGLSDWIINIVFETNYEGDDRCEASIEEDLKYHEADITIYDAFWKNDPEHREKNIVHELTHLVLCRLHPHLSPSGDDALEEVVQSIAMLFYKKS